MRVLYMGVCVCLFMIACVRVHGCVCAWTWLCVCLCMIACVYVQSGTKVRVPANTAEARKFW